MTERDLEQSMKIDIKLDVFEGPLDLLLHLIEKNKVIEDFLNVDLRRADKIKEFIDVYGFIMPLPSDGKYRIFNHN